MVIVIIVAVSLFLSLCSLALSEMFAHSLDMRRGTNGFEFIDLTNLPRFFPRWLLHTYSTLVGAIYLCYTLLISSLFLSCALSLSAVLLSSHTSDNSRHLEFSARNYLLLRTVYNQCQPHATSLHSVLYSLRRTNVYAYRCLSLSPSFLSQHFAIIGWHIAWMLAKSNE